MFRTMNINQLIRIEQINHYPHLRYPTLPPPPKKNHTKKEEKITYQVYCGHILNPF